MGTDINSERLTLTVEETRKLLGLSRGLMYEALRRNEIPSVRIGRRILVPRVALMRLLEGPHSEDRCTGGSGQVRRSGITPSARMAALGPGSHSNEGAPL